MFFVLPLGFVFSRQPRIADLEKSLRNKRERIRCPVCSWEPQKSDAWCCAPDGCWHVWNTFETRALCPGCSKQWEYTECLSCHVSSPHEDWYEVVDEDKED
jgi:hypothetical protein